MPKLTFSAHAVQQLDLNEIAFTDGDAVLDSTQNISSQQPVVSVATSVKNLRSFGSSSLLFTNFGIPSGLTVTGIELELRVTRLARIQDKTIQLWSQSTSQGKNMAKNPAEDHEIYGGPGDLWLTSNIDFSHPSFGVVIDLQPHQQYPSSNTV